MAVELNTNVLDAQRRSGGRCQRHFVFPVHRTKTHGEGRDLRRVFAGHRCNDRAVDPGRQKYTHRHIGHQMPEHRFVQHAAYSGSSVRAIDV